VEWDTWGEAETAWDIFMSVTQIADISVVEGTMLEALN
jgi:hypothetical protein